MSNYLIKIKSSINKCENAVEFIKKITKIQNKKMQKIENYYEFTLKVEKKNFINNIDDLINYLDSIKLSIRKINDNKITISEKLIIDDENKEISYKDPFH